ncbi:MAG: tRNA (adenosine(37)-N6)-dimethylallyltransferase MiaA [Cryobacterium sp.]|nr:tRNA (adenosine(37)-N6)-dimethylallyltransferase MiaA [Cryobacterium sp.]MBX3090754.1 tRNA (adenosine(37)-N6)-dimethylallyltransferase MiaA [Cryobacterium sp.]MCO5294144.1 tRNA (adenosine(37)-N6)-dimethylallyltransferase MiaA [Homoserinimonas sp.]
MIPLIAIVGATGTGKSGLSLDLAERLASRGIPAEIVNADSMQLYRGMDIGTAKLPVEDRRQIPHHLLDVLEVPEISTVAGYQSMARAAIAEIRSRGALPILVGGSGLYISSVIYDFDFPARDQDVRARLEAEAEESGIDSLYSRLEIQDPEAAASIGRSNPRRIIRALEVIELTGKPFGSGIPETPGADLPVVQIGLRMDRDQLVPKLDQRVRQMWLDGLVEEVEGLIPLGLEDGPTARRAIGYEQAIDQLHGRISEAEAIELASALTRKFARRQVSWFRRYREIHWLDSENPIDSALAIALKNA